jgi:hypothetical protein
MKVFVSMILILLASSSLCLAQTVLFSDDFEGGMNDAWVTPDGGWVAEDGHLSVTTSCGFQTCSPNLYSGGVDQSSYLVYYDFMVTEALNSHGAHWGTYVAMSAPIEPQEGTTNGYGFGFGWSSDGTPENATAGIQRYDNSVMTQIAEYSGSEFWNEPNVLYHVIVGRLGADLVMKKWADGEVEPNWLMSVTDENYLSGYWLLTTWNTLGWIDNFRVEGVGTVTNEDMTWGGVKALYR